LIKQAFFHVGLRRGTGVTRGGSCGFGVAAKIEILKCDSALRRGRQSQGNKNQKKCKRLHGNIPNRYVVVSRIDPFLPYGWQKMKVATASVGYLTLSHHPCHICGLTKSNCRQLD
ncbi:MAG: hypothetical protein VX374_15110, partial [Pseudomonadota bacterium]|nr:hypothetical protein [Pseudomonadota bacterium]